MLHERREQTPGLTRLLPAAASASTPRCASTREGERFIEAVEAAGGPALLARVWEGPEWLPTLDEIRDPSAWIARVGAAPAG